MWCQWHKSNDTECFLPSHVAWLWLSVNKIPTERHWMRVHCFGERNGKWIRLGIIVLSLIGQRWTRVNATRSMTHQMSELKQFYFHLHFLSLGALAPLGESIKSNKIAAPFILRFRWLSDKANVGHAMCCPSVYLGQIEVNESLKKRGQTWLQLSETVCIAVVSWVHVAALDTIGQCDRFVSPLGGR